jgi:DHA1 family multidrug resistance protein-like MFS transporter
MNRDTVSFSVIVPFFLSSFAWNFALGLTYLLTPLYAHSLGLTGVQIGVLVALPVVPQVVLTLLGGALVDRVGGKRMAMASCMMICAAGLVFMASAGFALMFVAQLLMAMSRAVFWPATWSLASQLPGSPGMQMGRLNGATNIGQIGGIAAAGAIIVAAGFRTGFLIIAAVGFAALVLNQIYRHPAAPLAASPPPILVTYRRLLGNRIMRYSILCAYISALPLSLSFSFFPILLAEQGFDSDVTGALVSLRALGAIAAGLAAGRLVRNVHGLRAPLVAAMVVGGSVMLTAAVSQPAPIALFVFALGAGSATMTVYFQMLITLASPAEVRGSAMALGGLGWGISNLTTPLAMGLLKDYVDIQLGFYVMGGIALACGLALVPLQRWAFGADHAVAGQATL